MNKEAHRDDEDIDFKKVFKALRNFFKSILRLLLSVIFFYAKKIYLFLALLIIGLVLGFFIDMKIGTKDLLYQEIVIQPKYDTTSYFYEFVEKFEEKMHLTDFQKEVGLEKNLADNIKELYLEPILEIQDLVDNFYVKYNNKNFLAVVEDYDKEDLMDEKLRNFYTKHKLVIFFKKEMKENSVVADLILNAIRSNAFYKEQLNLVINQATETLNEDKKSLKFIDDYLENYSKSSDNSEKEVYIFANEAEIPTISSILKQKEILISRVNKTKRVLELDKRLFSLISYGVITSAYVPLHKKALILIPLLLCFLVSLWFFSIYMSKQIKAFVEEE